MSQDLALIRIEYKLDLIIRALQDKGLMLADLPGLSGIERDACPVCEQPNKLLMDLQAERITKACSCKLPKAIVAGISKLNIPVESEKHYGSRAAEQEGGVPSEQEESGAGDGSG